MPCRVAVVADPQLGETESAQRRLGPVDLRRAVRTDTAVPYGIRLARHAAAGLSHVRRPSCRDAARTSAFVNPAVDERELAPRSAAARWPGRWSPRSSTLTPSTTVAPSRRGDRTDDVHQLGLAVVAAVGVVGAVGRAAISSVTTGVQRRPHSSASARQSASSSPASDGDTAVTAWARSPEHAVGDGRQERRVGPAAERDHDPIEVGQAMLENVQRGIHHELIVPSESPRFAPRPRISALWRTYRVRIRAETPPCPAIFNVAQGWGLDARTPVVL